ncbi:MAG: DUF3365 domain-containing protein [Planctomycetes bacterium]|nr:DUF3365 domain-containing protein [Planctomycetota bacterium]
MTMRTAPRVWLCACALLAACGGDAWRPSAADDPAQAARRQAAADARDAMAQQLLGELTAALAAGGPTAAIGICRERAPAIAASVAAQRGVGIGRTSQRLRNPANAAPAWAVAYTAGPATEPAFFTGPRQQLGALFPIRLQPMCVQCHGRGDEVTEPVRAALQASYPHDAATGFAAGDLRGWFWVEVP